MAATNISCVGLAYFLTAVLASIGGAGVSRSGSDLSKGGMLWSLVAGIAGAVGAFVFCLHSAPKVPRSGPSIVFAGAPVVNAVVAVLQHPPPWWSWFRATAVFSRYHSRSAGLVVLVTLYKPGRSGQTAIGGHGPTASVNPQK